ncbi:MAG: hypothetical protein ACRD1A_10145, partial [Terriglobales bacterium]
MKSRHAIIAASLGLSLLLAACTQDSQRAASDLLAEAHTYEQQGKDAAAQIEIQRALQVAPRSVVAYRALADLQLKQQNWTAAYAALREIVNLDPRQVQAHLDL